MIFLNSLILNHLFLNIFLSFRRLEVVTPPEYLPKHFLEANLFASH